ncbi:MAG: hypothetical protein PHD06_07740 [Bacteroidales bacterium]|nr:hypothetical protein [Bacteroidales bacterium]MDY0196297.1 hypothetical protein [Tenuifilaceae bacterium]
MLYLCLKYKVIDFLQWHNTFMKNESLRVAAGIKVENILRSRNNPNFLTILYGIESIEESESFIKLASTEKMMKDLTIEGNIAVEYFEVFY